jgi:hypothetical protein
MRLSGSHLEEKVDSAPSAIDGVGLSIGIP